MASLPATKKEARREAEEQPPAAAAGQRCRWLEGLEAHRDEGAAAASARQWTEGAAAGHSHRKTSRSNMAATKEEEQNGSGCRVTLAQGSEDDECREALEGSKGGRRDGHPASHLGTGRERPRQECTVH